MRRPRSSRRFPRARARRLPVSASANQSDVTRPSLACASPLVSPQAREGSYFKSEQEDELSAYRKRRIREGAIAPDPERVLIPGETDPRGRERAWVSDTKLAEIHAQEARVTAPPDVLRRRVSTQMPPISTAGNAAGRGAMHGTYRIPSTRIAKWGGLGAFYTKVFHPSPGFNI